MKVRMIERWGPKNTPLRLEHRLSLRTNFSWVLFGNIFYVAFQWGMLVAIAKLSNTEAVGQFSLGLAVTAPVTMFARLRLRDIQVTDAKQEYPTADYLGLRIITALLGMALIVGIVLVTSYSRQTKLVIAIIGVAKAFESVSDILYGVLQHRERMDFIGKSMIFKGAASLAALSIGLFVTGSMVWAVTGLAITWGLFLAFYDFPNTAHIFKVAPDSRFQDAPNISSEPAALRPRYRPRIMIMLVRLSLPLGIITLFTSLNTTIPRYFIEHHWGQAQLGIFTALAYVVIADQTVIKSVGRATTPRMAQYYAAGKWRKFMRLLLSLTAGVLVMGALGVIVAMLFGRDILLLLYQPEYAAASDVFALLMAGAAVEFVASQWNYAAIATRRFAIQLPLSAATTALTLVFGYLLIPSEGMRGAAIVLMINSAGKLLGSGMILAYVMLYKRPVSATADPALPIVHPVTTEPAQIMRAERPLRVLTVTHAPYAPPWDEGIKNLLRRLVEFLNDESVEVATVSLRQPSANGQRSGIMSRIRILERYTTRVREFDPDVVLLFAGCRSWLGVKTLLFKLLGHKTPLVVHVSSVDSPLAGYRFLLAADRILVISPFLHRYFPDAPLIYPFLPLQVRVQDVKPPAQLTNRTPLQVLFLGAWEPGRGVEVLIEAIAIVKEHIPVHLTLALNSFARLSHDQLFALIDQHGIADYVTVKGYVDLTAAYNACHVVVIPRTATHRMSFPVRIIESLVAGRPLVVTTACDMDQLIDGCGLAVPPGNATLMAHAIEQLADPLFYLQCAANTERLAQEYDSERTLRRLLGELRKAAGQPQHSSQAARAK